MDRHDVGEEGQVEGSRDTNDPDLDVLITGCPPIDQAAISRPPGYSIKEAAQRCPVGGLEVRLELDHEVGSNGGHIS